MAEEKAKGFSLYRHYLWFAIAVGLLLPASSWLMYAAMVNGWVWLSFFAGFATYLITGSAIVHFDLVGSW